MNIPFNVKNREWLVIGFQRIYEPRLETAIGKERRELQKSLRWLRAEERKLAWKWIDQLQAIRVHARKGGQATRQTAMDRSAAIELLWSRSKLPERNRPAYIAKKLDLSLTTVHTALDKSGLRPIKKKLQ